MNKTKQLILLSVPIFLVFALGVTLRVYFASNYDIANYSADSLGRANIILKNLDGGLKLWYSDIWPNAYFWIYSIPLYLAKSLTTFKATQVFFSSLNILLVFYILFYRLGCDKKLTLLSCYFLAIFPLSIGLNSTILAEVLFLTLTLLTFAIYQSNKKNALLMSGITVGLACQTRIEGFILLACLAIYDICKNKSLLNIIYLSLPTIILVGVYEYQQFLRGKPIFFEILSNSTESQITNTRMGFASPLSRFLRLKTFLWNNFSSLSLFIPFGVYQFVKKEQSLRKPLIFFYFSYLTIITYQVYTGGIIVLERYWLSIFVFSLLFIPYTIRLVPRREYQLASCMILFLLGTHSGLRGIELNYRTLKKENITHQEIAQTLNKYNDVNTIYLDDIESKYLFLDIIVKSKLLYARKEDRIFETILYDVNRSTKEYNLENQINYLKKLESYQKVDIFILINNSLLYKFFQEREFKTEEFSLTLLKSIGEYNIFCTHNYCHKTSIK